MHSVQSRTLPSLGTTVVVLLHSSFDQAFFQSRTGFAREILRQFLDYGLRMVILGNSSQYASLSDPLRDLIRESNRSRLVCFLAVWDALEQRLAAATERTEFAAKRTRWQASHSGACH